jgi:hypothetical protein
MCWETEAGLVQSVGKIQIDKPNDYPDFLQDFQYVIFKEEDDRLGLTHHAVCIDLVLDSRGATPIESYKRLKSSVVPFINVTLSCFDDKQKAYDALRNQKEKRDETRELIYRAYNEVLAHNETILYAKLRPHYKRLCDSIYLELKKESPCNEHDHFYSSAYNEEEIEKLHKSQKLSDEKIRQILAYNYYLLLNNMIQQNQRTTG